MFPWGWYYSQNWNKSMHPESQRVSYYRSYDDIEAEFYVIECRLLEQKRMYEAGRSAMDYMRQEIKE